MDLNRLLKRQVNKYLGPEDLQNPQVAQFIQAVNSSYYSYERDHALAAHAFSLSEQDYADINSQLQEEIEIKREGLKNLKEAIRAIAETDKESIDINGEEDDFLKMLQYLEYKIRNRKRIEEELKESEARLSKTASRLYLLIANLQKGVLLEDENGKVLLVNELFCDMMVNHKKPLDLIGQDAISVFVDVCRLCKKPGAFRQQFQELDSLRKVRQNMRLELADGRVLKYDYVPIFVDNCYNGQLWKFEDITKEVEDRRAMQRLSMVASANTSGVLFANQAGGIYWCNDGFLTMTGFSMEEVLGKTPIELCIGPLSDRNTLRSVVERFSEGKNFTVEVVYYRKDGSYFWGRTKGQAFKNPEDGALQYFGIIEDITAQKNAELALQNNEEKYRNIIANMNLGLLEVDVIGIIQYANQSFCNMSGFELGEIVGQDASELFTGKGKNALLESKRELREQGLSDAYELPVKNKRGELRWWFVSGAPSYNDMGELVGSIGIHLDITDQKEMELELKDARELAIQSSRAKETFLANMSHEIRTPMNAVLGMTRQLLKTELQDQQRFFLNVINNSAEHLLVIIDDILDMSKIEAGKLQLEFIGFRPAKMMVDCLQVMRHRAEEKGLHLFDETVLDPSLILVGDPHRITQIVLNLLSNAVKFTEKGSVKVAGGLQRDEQHREVLAITISDTGIGISEEYQQQIFENFTQEDRNMARKYGGSGLGMAITHQLIKLMQGRISLQSQKGKGASFTIVLPVFRGHEKDIPAEKISAVGTNSLLGKRILLVEDNEMNRLVAVTVLGYAGASVVEVTNGLEAVQELRDNQQYDAVLMDVQMPVMDGLEATRLVREELNLTIPVIALTANAIKGENERCKKAGMNDFVSKPFDEAELIAKLLNWITPAPDSKPASAAARELSVAGNAKLYDLSSLKQISRGDKTFEEKMLNLFIDQTPQLFREMYAAFKEGSFLVVRALAHKVKPSIDNMGINSLYSLVKDIEKIAGDGSAVDQLEKMIIQAMALLDKAVEQLLQSEILDE